MTKKTLKPQQSAPVQREINTTSSAVGTGLTSLSFQKGLGGTNFHGRPPFAGDDAE